MVLFASHVKQNKGKVMETQTKTFKKYFTCYQTLLCMHQLLIKGKIYLHKRIYNLLQSHDVTYTLMSAIRKRKK